MKRFFAVGCLVFSGCAALNLSQEQCRSADWYFLGDRDGRYGAQPQIELYTQQCAAHGVRADAARYHEGWIYGNSEWRVQRRW